jgi:2-methylcitrate dehydratase PrpD
MRSDLEVSSRLARHIATTRYEDLPSSTIVATKRALLDGLGVMIAASGLSDDVRPFVELARAQGGMGEATILGNWERVNAAGAAFANGALGHALDFEDAFDLAPTHPNASLLPAALAIAQSRANVSGKDFLLAMAIGCDVSCRVALSAGSALERTPWYPPTILGSLGAIAATSKLMQLNERQIKDAFSLMLCQTACPAEIKYSEHTVIRAVREAFPAQAAVIAAQLAAQGVRGFDLPLEGRAGFFNLFANGSYDPAKLFDRLSQHFYIDDLSFKPWPCCRGTHPYIEAAQQLRAAHEIGWRSIKRVSAAIGPVQRMLSEPIERKRAPSTVIDAKFSIPFTVATAFIAPEVTLDCFTPATLQDANVRALAQRVTCEFKEHGIGPTNGALEIELEDGRRLSAEIPQALGHPSRPLDDERLKAKFIDCAMRAAKPLSRAEAESLCDRVLSVEEAASFDAALFGVGEED